jgi:hypothetical protein
MSQNVTPLNKFSEDLTHWSYNGVELTLDIQDVETIERYEDAFAALDIEEKAIPKDGKKSVQIRAYCRMFRNLFNALFGEGTDTKMFGEKDNAREMTECYEAFLQFVSNQHAGLAEAQSRIVTRFSPNRAQRRAAAKADK